MRRIARLWRNLVSRREVDRDLDDEIAGSIQLLIEEKVQAGNTEAEARRVALLELGGPEPVKEGVREIRAGAFLESLIQDLEYGWRELRRDRKFFAVVIATLIIAIGSNTAVFSVVNAVLLRPLTAPDSNRVVRLIRTSPGGSIPTTSIPLAGVWLQQGGVLRNVAAHRLDLANLTGTSVPEQVPVARVTTGFFSLFGARLLAGRTFSADEDLPRGPRVAVLSYGLWVRQFGANANTLGRTIVLGSEPYLVIGVLDQGFDSEQFSQLPDVYVPLQVDPNTRDVGGEWCFVSAALAPGATLSMANTQLQVLAEALRQAHPEWFGPQMSFGVQPAREALVSSIRPSLLLLLGAVVLVLLVACANVASLLFTRGTVRARELAVRTALGANRSRLVRQPITESLMLGVIGAVGGAMAGILGIRALLVMYPAPNSTIDLVTIPRIGNGGSAVTLDWRVLAFTAVVALIATVVSGFLPALQSSRVDLQRALKQGGSSTGPGHTRIRSVLVVAEIACALMLLVGAGLLIRSSIALRTVEPGFDAGNVLTMRMAVSGTAYERRDGIAQLTRDGLRRVRALPGVAAASTACCMPLERVWQLPFVIQGRPADGPSRRWVGWTFVSPGYFDVFRIPIVRGRDFDDRDDAHAPGVVIINEEMARRFWPNANPLDDRLIIGRGVRPDYNVDPVRQIVGIVGDVRDQALNRPARPAMYVPVAQVPDGVTVLNVRLLPIVWLTRSVAEPHQLAPQVSNELQLASGGLPVARIRSMDEIESESVAQSRFDMLLMTVFAICALSLGAVGVYGMMSYSVEQRTHEVGVRLALGAEPGRVRAMILRQGLLVTAAGVAIGLAASLTFAKVLAGALYGVSTRDVTVFVTVSFLMLAVGLCATWGPAWKASRITPMAGLKCD